MIRSFEDLKNEQDELKAKQYARPQLSVVPAKLNWASEVKQGVPRAALEAPVKRWWVEQMKKKERGLPNEIEDNEKLWRLRVSQL